MKDDAGKLRQTIKELKERIGYLEKELVEVREDRQLFRNHFSERFKWWIQLLGENKTPNMAWLVEADAKYLRSFKFFVW